MKLSIGIVGLPNVGKSTLFNALTNNDIPAENYPFCTIDPNIGIVPVADSRLVRIAEMIKPEKLTPAVIEFYDIAGLVRGAHKGEGLGNQFLANIKNTQVIAHVLRYFDSTDIIHVEKTVDPLRDKDIIETELILKDISTVDGYITKNERLSKNDKVLEKKVELAKELKKHLDEGKLAITLDSKEEESKQLRSELFLITDKRVIYVINGHWEKIDSDLVAKLRQELKIPDMFEVLPLDIKQEFELSLLEEQEREEFKKELGIEYSGLELLTRVAYKLLNLISYFTAGEQEVRAWTITDGSTAPQAAGTIHTDIEKKFVAAEITDWESFINFGGWSGVKHNGKMRLEGREYIVKDGDVILFKHGA